MDASIAALLGAFVGGAAGIAGQLVAARYASRNERRRLAVEAGIREWEQMTQRVAERGGQMYPAAYFVYFANELIGLIDRDGQLTRENYRDLMRRADVVREVIAEETRRRQEGRAE